MVIAEIILYNEPDTLDGVSLFKSTQVYLMVFA